MKLKYLFALFSLTLLSDLRAEIIEFTSGPDANGHYYELVEYSRGDDITWKTAQSAAISRGGYLATITSSAENAFLTDGFAKSDAWASAWIGASDSAAEGKWLWVTGPETGTQFWSGAQGGSAVGGQYANWGASEPNDYPALPSDLTGEDYAVFATGSEPGILKGQWGDANNEGTNAAIVGFIVEYNSNPSTVPEPSSMALLGLGGIGVACGAYRRRWTSHS